MPVNRTFEVKALSRVEGEGRLYVKLRGNVVEHVELNIYEPPRFFESFLVGREVREVPDITARICGICPVAYQMSACHALEKALGIKVTPEIRKLRRLLYCGEWIESHTLHMHLLHAPDFLGYESGISMAADHKIVVERGLRMKKIGNQLVEVLGGRAIHPINVAVGGFYRAPRVNELRVLLPDLEWGLAAAVETLQFVTSFDFPDFEIAYEFVSLQHDSEYPMNDGALFSSKGLKIPVENYEVHFQERHLPHSTALHSVTLPDGTSYFVGPLARLNNCFDQLSPTAKRSAETCGVEWPSRNNFKSIVARAIEVIDAFEEAVEIVSDYRAEPVPSRLAFELRAGEGCHATEAPRGLLYHRYRIGEDGLVAEAKIVPPTSQNQGQIEDDLRRYVPQIVSLDDPSATRKCEHLIRNYDPAHQLRHSFFEFDDRSMSVQTINVNRDLGAERRAAAEAFRQELTARGIFAVRLISSPGAGKTTLLEKTAQRLSPDCSVGILVGDVETERDAERLSPYAPTKQITTGGACHLELPLVEKSLPALGDQPFDFLFIEDVGNLICPASHDLGEHVRVILLSTTEGDDKPGKYPKAFRTSQVMIISKLDLLPHVPFEVDRAIVDARLVQPAMTVYPLCATTGEGMAAWYDFLVSTRQQALCIDGLRRSCPR